MSGLLRFAANNFLYTPTHPTFGPTIISASSQLSSLPASFVLDQLASKVWRSDGPYVVVEEFNDRIDFDEGGGQLTATLTPGTYGSVAAYAAEVQTQLLAAGALTYSVGQSTNRFVISASGTFSLLWDTGTNSGRTAGIDLGFDVTANDTGAALYNGDYLAYQGQHFWQLRLPTNASITLAAVIGHNVSAEGGFERREVVVQGSFGDFPLVSFEQELETVGNGGMLLTEPLQAPDTPWGPCISYRIVFRDISNPDGFNEFGWVYIGDMETPSVRPSINFERKRDELSEITQAIDGAHHGDIRPVRTVYGLEWLEIEDADVQILEDVQDQTPPGTCFLINFDSEDLEDTVYGYWGDGLVITLATPTLATVKGTFVESVG